MTIVRCTRGHFYDAEHYRSCPYCGAHPWETAITERFSRLGSVSFLASGTAGDVYRISGEKEYALKIIRCGGDQGRVRNALYELKLMERLTGEPRAVQLIYSEAETDGSGTVCMLMDYHQPLEKFLTGSIFFDEDLITLALGVCDALTACKEHGVLHLDVQPRNIYADDLFSVKLGDFSHSLLVSDAASNRIPRGTPGYMAPEVYREGICSERSDIYSLGLVIYYLFNQKKLPFTEGVTKEEAIQKRVDGTPLPEIRMESRDLQNDLNRVIRKACACDPEERYPDLSEMRKDLEKLLEYLARNPENNARIHYEAEESAEPLFPADLFMGTNNSKRGYDADPFAVSCPLPDSDTNNSKRGYDADPSAYTCPLPVSDTNNPMRTYDADPFAVSCPLPDSDTNNSKRGYDADPSAYTCPLPVSDTNNSKRGYDTKPFTATCPLPDSAASGPMAAPKAVHGVFKQIWESAAARIRDLITGARSGPSDFQLCETPQMAPAPARVSGAAAEPVTPTVKPDDVQFSAIAPKKLEKGDYSVINVIMYEESFRHVADEALRNMDEPAQETGSGVLKAVRGAEIKIVLSAQGVEIRNAVKTGIWQGKHLDFSFTVYLPENYDKRQIPFMAEVYINQVIAASLEFVVKCSASSEQNPEVSRVNFNSAFVSYASQDRYRVAAIVQGMKKARPDLDIFFDVESLRSGENWEPKLYREIEQRDILYLCWSHFARQSKWVETEWRYVFTHKGAERIEPVAIESPEICPPPKELSHKHFNDMLVYIINASEK